MCITVLLFIEASSPKHLQVLSGKSYISRGLWAKGHRGVMKNLHFMYMYQATEKHLPFQEIMGSGTKFKTVCF